MKIILNRDTEKTVLSAPAIIKFRIRGNIDRGMVTFGVEAVKQMNLKAGDKIEFIVDDGVWFVQKTDSANGYNLFKVGARRSNALAMYGNKVARFFLSTNVINKNVCEVIAEKDKNFHGGNFAYPRWLLTIRKIIK